MGLAFEAPADFAAVRHDLRREAGRLVLVDRRRQRLQLTWSTLPDGKKPDPEALARDWRARVEAALGERGPLQPPPELRPLAEALPPNRGATRDKAARAGSPGPLAGAAAAPGGLAGAGPPGGLAWAGWISDAPAATGPPGTRTDAVTTVGGLLVDAVLLDPHARGRAPSTETLRLLGSAAPATLPDGATRWTAFGLDARAPAGWSCAAARQQPAASVLTFADEHGRTARLWRRGMASTWFDGDAAALLDASTPAGFGPSASTKRPDGNAAVGGAGREPARPWARLAGKARHRRDLLWHDGAANAVLGVTVRGPRRRPLPEPLTFLPPA